MIYLGKSKARALQIPILCVMCDKLNSVNGSKTCVHQSLSSLSWTFTHTWAQPAYIPAFNVVLNEWGELKGKSSSNGQCYHAIHLPIPCSIFVCSLVFPSLLRKTFSLDILTLYWCYNHHSLCCAVSHYLAIILRMCLPGSGVNYYLVPLTFWWLMKARRNWYNCLPYQIAAYFPKLA